VIFGPENTGGDLGRLRRRVVFDRLAVRLSVDDGTQWILKGEAALEFRLRGRARATKDLDLAVTSGAADGLVVREMLIEDPDGDWFSFRVKEPVVLARGHREPWGVALPGRGMARGPARRSPVSGWMSRHAGKSWQSPSPWNFLAL
jgi:hypothetical protein